MPASEPPRWAVSGKLVIVERAAGLARITTWGTFGRIRTVLDKRWQWIVLAQILQAAGMFALFKLTANLLAVASFGRFSLALAVAGGVNVILSGPLAGWASRYYQEATESDSVRTYRRTLAGAALGGSAILAAIATIVGLAVPGALRDISVSQQLFALGIAVGLSGGVVDITIATFNADFAAARRQRSSC